MQRRHWLKLTSLAMIWMMASSAMADDVKPVQVRVLTYNIHHGEGNDGKVDLERIANLIKAAKPDFAALQEVDNKATRTGRVDQAVELGKLTEMHAAFGAAMPFQGGEYGVAVLSKRPIVGMGNCRFPGQPGREPRVALIVETRVAGCDEPIRMVSTHWDFSKDPADRLASAKMLVEDLAHNEAGLSLLAGDFNTSPTSEEIQQLTKHWRLAEGGELRGTYPADKPTEEIDMILAGPKSRWKLISREVLDEKAASDHRPLLAVWELLPAPESP